MKIALYFLAILFVCFFSNTSCTFDNEEELLEGFVCDTANLYYTDLTYIFLGICAACHNSTDTYNEDIIMDSYDDVVSSINTGWVWPAINHQNGYAPMPDGLPKLSHCNIEKIGAWINAGMPEKE